MEEKQRDWNILFTPIVLSRGQAEIERNEWESNLVIKGAYATTLNISGEDKKMTKIHHSEVRDFVSMSAHVHAYVSRHHGVPSA